MVRQADHFHGSDLEKIEEIYHINKEDIIPFGANVNPLGISPLVKKQLANHINSISEYPDREYTALRQAIATYAKADFDKIVVGNGSTELISSFIRLVNPNKAVIIEPTYSEYSRDITLGGGTLIPFMLEEADYFKLDVNKLCSFLDSSIDLLIICNPNNPTSTAIPVSDLNIIINKCKELGIFVMIDETYVEFVKVIDFVTAIPLTNQYENLVVLRGVSKFFAAPGLRLGYAICGDESLINVIDRIKNPWSINTLAAKAGEIMFSDTDYINETRRVVETEKGLVPSALSLNNNIKVYKPEANFILVKILNPNVTSDMIFDHCIKKNMMIRDCSDFNGLDNSYIRFCFMDPHDDDNLVNAILDLLQ